MPFMAMKSLAQIAPGGACASVSYRQTVPDTRLMQPLPRKLQSRKADARE